MEVNRMTEYTEVYSNGQGIKDITASRFYYLSECLKCRHEKKLNKNKYNFMRHYQKQHYEYIVYS